MTRRREDVSKRRAHLVLETMTMIVHQQSIKGYTRQLVTYVSFIIIQVSLKRN